MSIKAVGYVDDITILVRGSYEKILMDLLQEALRATEAWCGDKSLTIQGDKTVVMVCTRQYKVQPLGEITIDRAWITYMEQTKYLGVILDRKLLRQRYLEKKHIRYLHSGSVEEHWGQDGDWVRTNALGVFICSCAQISIERLSVGVECGWWDKKHLSLGRGQLRHTIE